jgi:aryl-alcohol dehydrogenase-like predicted oxidoreductase
MEHRRLGKTGLMVSELCLGCMTFGREQDEGD